MNTCYLPATGRVKLTVHRHDGVRAVTFHRIVALHLGPDADGELTGDPLVLFAGQLRLASSLETISDRLDVAAVEIERIATLPGEPERLPGDHWIDAAGERIEPEGADR